LRLNAIRGEFETTVKPTEVIVVVRRVCLCAGEGDGRERDEGRAGSEAATGSEQRRQKRSEVTEDRKRTGLVREKSWKLQSEKEGEEREMERDEMWQSGGNWC
jgi:hypothetical protein